MGSVLSVVIPAHNEERYLRQSLSDLVEGLNERELDYEIAICENGSVDRTRELAHQLSEEIPGVKVLELETADYGRALRAGYLATSGEFVVNFDVDLVDLRFLDRALPLARGGADLVIGSKTAKDADDTRPLSRRVVTRTFGLVLRLGFGLRASDTHGLKLLRRQPTEDLVAACVSGADIFDTELVLRSERAGLRVVEIPVHVEEWRPPRTAITSRIPRTLKGLGVLRWRLLAERRHRAG